MDEQWSWIVDYEGLYEVSTLGEVRSHHVHRGFSLRTLKQGTNGSYPIVVLYKNKKAITRLVHRLVLETFLGPAPDGMEGCHNDGNPMNNQLDNLRWDTHSANQLEMWEHSGEALLSKRTRPTHCKRGHEFTEENTYINNRGHMVCRACHREHEKRRRDAQGA